MGKPGREGGICINRGADSEHRDRARADEQLTTSGHHMSLAQNARQRAAPPRHPSAAENGINGALGKYRLFCLQEWRLSAEGIGMTLISQLDRG
ncbi:MAG: hypothetical protein QOF40_1087 [Actinomycetota bacterium]|nr:hypothetical protein [Actinomycetota bacterium]